MREIKFRAWDDVEHVMHYFDLYDLEKPRHLGGQLPYTVDGKTYYFSSWRQPLMQYTGFDDLKRAPIYDGDVFTWTSGNAPQKHVVGWTALGGWYLQTYTYRSEENGGTELWRAVDAGGIVIGNIYENPELLTNN